jgi:hypothetical protein
MKHARGPLLGIAMALASQGLLWMNHSDLALPRWVAFYGCAMGLLLSSTVRMLFSPVTGQLLGANAPALWLKQAAESRGGAKGPARFVGDISAIVAVAAIGARLAADSGSPGKIVMLVTILAVAHRISKRA